MFNTPLLSGSSLSCAAFPATEKVLRALQKGAQENELHQALYQLIKEAPDFSFLLGAVIDFFSQAAKMGLCKASLALVAFEHWLNASSGSQAEIRAKIVGKYLPREAYQAFFPIGGNKMYDGSHFVIAHLSPDVDTTIASFWGWVDAFAAQVGKGVHVWSLPGGAPDSPIIALFARLFNPDLFACLPDTSPAVSPVNGGWHTPGTGTASLRDFCNLDEVKLDPAVRVISVVDHHKCFLKTESPPTALIADVESCNTLMAEQMFNLNDRFSLGGMCAKEIDKEIEEIAKQPASLPQLRIFQKLLMRKQNAMSASVYFVHPERELREYVSFLHAILEDTDLLTKASVRDVLCVKELLNRSCSLLLREECEVLDFDDIPNDHNFVKAAVRKLLQQKELHALYKQTNTAKESDLTVNIALAARGEPSSLFLDTKEQNGCARVGQIKLFASNFPTFLSHKEAICRHWLEGAIKRSQEKPDIDLHIEMISTVAGAEEAFSGHIGPYTHQDELWVYAAPTEMGQSHFKTFLGGFKQGMKKFLDKTSVELRGDVSNSCAALCKEQFPAVALHEGTSVAGCVAIFRFPPGAVNSRKVMISPHLPRLITLDARPLQGSPGSHGCHCDLRRT